MDKSSSKVAGLFPSKVGVIMQEETEEIAVDAREAQVGIARGVGSCDPLEVRCIRLKVRTLPKN